MQNRPILQLGMLVLTMIQAQLCGHPLILTGYPIKRTDTNAKTPGQNSWGQHETWTATGMLEHCNSGSQKSPSTPSVNWQVLKEGFLNNSLNWQPLEGGRWEEHSATDGWLASNRSVSVSQLSFPPEFTAALREKRGSSWTSAWQELLHHSLGDGSTQTATWVSPSILHISTPIFTLQ